MAEKASHVTMVQRYTTYIVSMPKDRLANVLNGLLPATWAYAITRWRKIRFQNYFYKQAIEKPAKTRAYIEDFKALSLKLMWKSILPQAMTRGLSGSAWCRIRIFFMP